MISSPVAVLQCGVQVCAFDCNLPCQRVFSAFILGRFPYGLQKMARKAWPVELFLTIASINRAILQKHRFCTAVSFFLYTYTGDHATLLINSSLLSCTHSSLYECFHLCLQKNSTVIRPVCTTYICTVRVVLDGFHANCTPKRKLLKLVFQLEL